MDGVSNVDFMALAATGVSWAIWGTLEVRPAPGVCEKFFDEKWETPVRHDVASAELFARGEPASSSLEPLCRSETE